MYIINSATIRTCMYNYKTVWYSRVQSPLSVLVGEVVVEGLGQLAQVPPTHCRLTRVRVATTIVCTMSTVYTVICLEQIRSGCSLLQDLKKKEGIRC